MTNESQKLEIKDLKRRLFNTSLKTAMLFIILGLELIFIVSFMIKTKIIPNPTNTEKEKVVVINFNKEVTVPYVHKIMNKMDKKLEDNTVKGFLFIVNSPGGSPSASDELSEYLKYVNKKKSVTMYVESMAASGAYYIASAVKPLIANKNAIVGSIGVIMPHYNVGTLAKKVGIEEDYLAAGKFKKPVSFFKPLDKENKDYLLNNMILPTYNNFIQSVADNRGIPFEKIKTYAEGTIYIANDKKIKDILVDRTSNLYIVKNEIKEKFKNKIIFTNLELEENKGLFPLKTEVKLNIDNLTKNLLK
jgi:protease-4